MRLRRSRAGRRSGCMRCPRRWRPAQPHLQRHHLARLHPPAERRAPDPGADADRGRRDDAARRQEDRGAAGRAHRAGGRLRRRRRRAGWWVFTGDTGPNPALWQRLSTMNVAHLVIETAFGDDERQLARISRHLCPSALGHELTQPGRQRRGAHHPHQAGRDGRGDVRDRPARLAAPDLGPGGRRHHEPERRADPGLRLKPGGGARPAVVTRCVRSAHPGGGCHDW